MVRDKGKFVKGHEKIGGRQKKAVEVAYLEAFKAAVSLADWKDIITKAISQAIKGDAVARKFIADYMIGAPVQKIAPTTPDGENPYMGAEVGDLIELANKITGAAK